MHYVCHLVPIILMPGSWTLTDVSKVTDQSTYVLYIDTWTQTYISNATHQWTYSLYTDTWIQT